MKTITINNFCGGEPVEITTNVHPTIGALVSIYQSHGALSFQHSMRPKQAREMAAALIEFADALDEATA